VKERRLELEYHTNDDDRSLLRGEVTRLVKGWHLAIPSILVSVLFVPAIILVAALGRWYVLASLGILVCLIGALLFWWTRREQIRSLMATNFLCGRTTWHLEEEVIEIRWHESEGTEGRVRTTGKRIVGIRELPNFWVVALNEFAERWYVVPRRVFASSVEEDHFIKEVRAQQEKCLTAGEGDPSGSLDAARLIPPMTEMPRRLESRFPVEIWQGIAQPELSPEKLLSRRSCVRLAVELAATLFLVAWAPLQHWIALYKGEIVEFIFANVILLAACLTMTVMTFRLIMIGLGICLRQVHRRKSLSQIVLMGSEGVWVAEPERATFRPWGQLAQPELEADAIILRTEDHHLFAIIPVEASGGSDQLQDCFQDAQRWHSIAENSDFTDTAEPLPEIAETGNPFQSPSTE